MKKSRSGLTSVRDPRTLAILLATFIAGIFVSAALLFAVQPLFTKMVLPRLGGAASVWSVAMVFFQAVLLAGYAYAHLLSRVAVRRAVVIHLVLMLAACFWLPLHIAEGWSRPAPFFEVAWLLGLFAVSIGLPFFALAANAPLLQSWFVRTGHPEGKDPYFLYAASNAGSFLALLSYPILVEPFITLGDQRKYWTAGYFVLIALVAACGLFVSRTPAASVRSTRKAATPPLTWQQVGSWVALTAIPSGLLLAVTTHISTDVASVPLFWVLPLSLYLLTFVIAFQTRPLIPHSFVVRAQPPLVVGLVVAMTIVPFDSVIVQILSHLIVFFICTLLCHGELARRRPAPEHLTAFYMWISAGGMIGGIATGLIAPHVFNWVVEYPLLISLTLLCRPGLALPQRWSAQTVLLILLCAGLIAVLAFTPFVQTFSYPLFAVVAGILLGLTVQYWRQSPLPFAAIVAFVFFGGHYYTENFRTETVRNFFGILNVAETADGKYRVLWHGTAAQGSQQIRDDDGNLLSGRPQMISEFFEGAGISQVFNAVRVRVNGPTNVAVIGLGTGTLACSVRPGDRLTYYEIDPDIVRIARNPRNFNFISECNPSVPVVVGDARLTIADAPDGTYDLIFVDAFISAAIPIHLLTREAMATYLRKLKPHGIVAMHISNRNLELASVIAGVAEANGAMARVYDGGDVFEDASRQLWVPRVAVVARTEDDFGVLAQSEFWPRRDRDPAQRVWTDDYSNILGSVLRNLRARRAQSDD